MIKAVLFDLDETLLDIDLNAYLRMFALRRVRLLARIARRPSLQMALAFGGATNAMMGPRDDELTNAAFLCERMREQTGVPMDDPVIADCLDYYDCEAFNPAARATVRHRPMPGGHAAIEAARSAGLRVALATNPTFPAQLTRERMAWAELSESDFDAVTYLENATRTKPWARYYQEVAARLGCEPSECLMVGNDLKLDVAQQGCPLRTLYVGTKPDREGRCAWSGTMAELAEGLSRILERLSKQDPTEA